MLEERIFNISNSNDFSRIALEVFEYQSVNCSVYAEFLRYLECNISKINSVEKIPFLPIQFFKSHKVLSSSSEIEQVFLSSGTGGVQSQHFVSNLELYRKSFTKGFEFFYGPIEDYLVLALLPGYLEREGSSLIYMARDFINKSYYDQSGFFLNNTHELFEILEKHQDKKVVLLGVSYALLDFAEKYVVNIPNLIVMETGGMKGRRKEMIRLELHDHLKRGFGTSKIHSEYGMTELLSQAYSAGEGFFKCPPWMQIRIRDTEDALSLLPSQKSGGVNIIDLANLNSCSFIATQDLGKSYDDGSFEILGRFDNSDIRGCNLLIS
ncbi:acyltransferase [Urechidicola sp. KH5]